jgi:hypothetical protein
VESDLLVRGLDVADWWNLSRREDGTLKLSSRRLLAVLKHLPQDSAFMRALREDWTDEEYAFFGILNEMRYWRADFHSVHGQEFEPTIVHSPAQRRESLEDFEEKLKIRRGIAAQLNRGK